MRRSPLMLIALTGILLLSQIAGTRAASFIEKNFWLHGPRYDAALPECHDPAALARIAKRFGQKEDRYWNSDLQVVDFVKVREVAFRPWAEDSIPRRFCTGTVVISDGRKRQVNYSIIEDAGIIGASWGIEFCVVGLDRNWAYNPGCRMAAP